MLICENLWIKNTKNFRVLLCASVVKKTAKISGSKKSVVRMRTQSVDKPKTAKTQINSCAPFARGVHLRKAKQAILDKGTSACMILAQIIEAKLLKPKFIRG